MQIVKQTDVSKLQAKEIKKDADDLVDQADFEIGDTADQMRKVRI